MNTVETGAGDVDSREARATVQAPMLGGVGIGVADLDRSFAFYTDVLGMELHYELKVPGYADEKIMRFKGGKGSSIVLMRYTDGVERNYTNNPVKLVFYVPSASATFEAIVAAGLEVVREPTPVPAFNNAIVGFGRDPDGYLIEIVENAKLTVPYMAAVGIGVKDIAVSQRFYEGMFEMKALGGLIEIPNLWDEVILRHAVPGGTSIVPMHWNDGTEPNYDNVPVKLVHFLPDARATTEKIRAEDLPILTPPTNYNVRGVDALISLATDPDGYVLELVTSPSPGS